MKIGDLVVFPANLPIKVEQRAFQYEVIARCECGRLNCWKGRLPNRMEMHFTPEKAKIVKTKEQRAEEYLIGPPEEDPKEIGL